MPTGEKTDAPYGARADGGRRPGFATLTLLVLLAALAAFAAGGSAAPAVTILAPADGAFLDSGTLPITLDIQNISLNASAIGQGSVPGEGHYHIYLDGTWLRAAVELTNFLNDVSAGLHTLRIELAENNHTELGVSDAANFTVLSGAPRLRILSPASSAAWGSNSAELRLRVDNFTLSATAMGQAPVVGQGHFRVFVDGALAAEGATAFFNVTRLAVGRANLVRVELVGNDGAPLGDPVFDEVSLQPAPGSPELRLDSALLGAQVNASSLRAAFSAFNFTLDAAALGGAPVLGRGHYNLILDGALLGPGVDNPALVDDLATGTHTLAVELVNNDGSLLSTRVVDVVQFSVLPGAPRLTITSPADPSTVNASSARLQFAVGNFTLVPAGGARPNLAGEGHWHAFVDGVERSVGASGVADLTDLSEGPHVLLVELRANDNGVLPWPAFDTVRIVVLSGAPRISISSPAGTTTVASSSVEVVFAVANLTMSAAHLGGAPAAGEGHWRLLVDGEARGSGALPTTALAARLGGGTHMIYVELLQNDGTELPWPAFDYVTVTVPDGAPFLVITSPGPTTPLPLNFTAVRVVATNFSVVDKPDQTPVAGEGHWHIFLDGAFYGMAYTPVAIVQDLPAGPHTVRAVLVGNNHAFLNPLVADEVTFSVGGAQASIRITSPSDGAGVYGESATITVEVSNFSLEPDKITLPPVMGEGHWHLLLDGVYRTFTASTSFTVSGLLQGERTITARLYHNDHSPLGLIIESTVVLRVAGTPNIRIVAPENGLVTTDTTLALSVSVTNFTLDPLSAGLVVEPGHGHYHIYLDGALSSMESSLNVTLANLAIGPHTIRVELVNRDHTPLAVQDASATAIVTVQAAAPPPPGFLPGFGPLGAAAALGAAAVAAAFLGRARRRA